jgi:ribonuclease HI
MLGLRVAKDMAIESLEVFGDSELIINQVKNIYQAKQQRLKQYRTSSTGRSLVMTWSCKYFYRPLKNSPVSQ